MGEEDFTAAAEALAQVEADMVVVVEATATDTAMGVDMAATATE
jgi:hypothetical protein